MPRVSTELAGRIVQVPEFCLGHKGSNFKNLCVWPRFPGCPSIPSTSAITCVNCPCLFVGDRGKLGCIGPDRGLREVVLDIMGKLGGTKIKVDQELELGGAGLSWG